MSEPARHARLGGAERAALLTGARQILQANWTGTFTVPSRTLYPHQWCWDAAFIAIGRARADQRRAQQELMSLFTAQWANGMVPHIVFDPDVAPGAYFPGPGFWDSDRADGRPGDPATSGITQPPLHAVAGLEIWRHARDRRAARAFLRWLYPRLVAQHAHLARCRDVAGRGLAAIVHPWESGMDNTPVWDAELAGVTIPPGALPPYRRQDLVHADPADRPSDQAYDRYVYLAITYRDADYDDARLPADSPFLVEDPLFNAIWCWSAHALAEISEILGSDPGPHRATAARIHQGMLDHLWDPVARRFYALDVGDGTRIPKNTVGSLVPLVDPELPAEHVDAIVAELGSPHFHPPGGDGFLVPSFDLAGAEFDPRRYWRGPVWINTDWLLWRGLRQHDQRGLADQIAASMLRLVQRSGWREYFDPFTGAGYGSQDFSWTAALLIDLLGELEPNEPDRAGTRRSAGAGPAGDAPTARA
ncbi:MAG TPA: hypothetical protein VKG45_15460 [Actinomycetes bacterium]|nr:hypothetical protein [Actinomycetes bacterium]